MKLKIYNLTKVAVLFFFIVVPTAVNSQEFVRELYNRKDTKTLIREIDMNQWLMYQHYGANGWSSFCVVDATGTTYPLMAFQDCVEVNDFEIVDSIVYFCGTLEFCAKDESGDKIIARSAPSAVFGYFPLGEIVTPPGPSANCMVVNHFGTLFVESLDKLEVMNVADGIHVVMTGSTQTGEGLVLDAAATSHFPSLWNLYFDLSRTGEAFDDVALVDDYIVVTSRRPTLTTGYINLFDKPHSSSYSSLSSALYRGKVSYLLDDTLLLTRCEKNAFVTGTYSSTEGGLVMSGYNASSPIYSIVLGNISTLAPELQLRDIRFNKNSKVLDVLQHFAFGYDRGSIILHLDQTLGTSGITSNCHIFETNTFHSIACLDYNPDCTAASGHSNDMSFFAQLGHIQLGYNGSCSKKDDVKYLQLYHALTAEELNVLDYQTAEMPFRLNNELWSWPIIDKCSDNDQ